MLSKSTLLHLRLPFSFFLMPVFCFAAGIAFSGDWFRLLLTFGILHLMVYPASNGYNSYYDKDEESIGGLEQPPPVSKQLLYVSLLIDGIALLLSLLVSLWFTLGILLYGLVSKAYSNDTIRLKKMPVLGWLTVGVFQGGFTFLIVYQGVALASMTQLMEGKILFAALLSTVLLLGSYPMTQVYQHSEDARRGDLTISRMLGIRGTFLFTGGAFALATMGYVWYFSQYFSIHVAFAFVATLSPVVLFFGWWFWQTLQNPRQANFKNTMRLNLYSAICMNVFFIGLGIWLQR
ncbi:UbiA family prenyltransferase [Microscilla marina]|nr:UbiA family prenyltransferase [Microscilla marina]